MTTTLVQTANEAGSSSSMSLLSSGTDLFNMLGMSTDGSFSFASRSATPATKEDLIICAVLDDSNSTRVRIGRAVHNKTACAYDMYDGSLQLKESDQNSDGVFKCKDGAYVVMKQSEFDAMQPPPRAKPVQRARKPSVASEAAAAVSPLVVPPEAVPAPAPIGCSEGSDTKTVFVAGNFEGDGRTMGMVMSKVAPLACKAARRGNRIVVAIVGDLVPDVHQSAIDDPSTDSLSKANFMRLHGRELCDGHSIAPNDILLIAGMRELAWLRLANTDPRGSEIEAGGAGIASLRRPTPLSSARGMRRFPAVVAYNESLSHFAKKMAESAVEVAMMLKLVAMTRNTMNAPGLITNFMNKLAADRAVDEASLASLSDFLAQFGGSIDEGVSRLIHKGELTPEGLGVLPAAKALVSSVRDYATRVVLPYIAQSKLVEYVTNGGGEGNGVWITPKGTDYGHMRGKLPTGVDSETLQLRFSTASDSPAEWARELNARFSSFTRAFSTGDGAGGFYDALFAMSIDTQFNLVPLDGLASSPMQTCYGVASATSMPFACVQRRILVRKTAERHEQDLVSVLDQWTTINTDGYSPSAYWGVFTWCGGTMTDIGYPALVMGSADTYETLLHDVSVLLATMLMVRVKDKTLAEHGIAGLDGVVGPVVHTSARQTMRSVVFRHEHVDAAFVLLVPEAFVQTSLDYYAYDIESFKSRSAPMLATEGVIALPDDSEVSVGTFLHAENDSKHQMSGTRLWKLTKRIADQSALSPTALDQAALHSMAELSEPHTETRVLGHTIYHTRQSDVDPFAGLHVGLSNVPTMQSRMTLDTDMTPTHRLFRVVARE